MRTCMIAQIILDSMMAAIAIWYTFIDYQVSPWVFLVWVLVALEGHVSKYSYWRQREQDKHNWL